MKKIIYPRMCGKTTELIKISNKEDIPIVCLDIIQKKAILDLAKKYGIKICEPATLHELQYFKYYADNRNLILVDNADDILEEIFRTQYHVNINTATFSK